MSPAAPFLAAIREAPDDDAPRLIYADRLDENGEPERAEFIRVQCELAQTDSPVLRQREAKLLAEHHDTFAGALAAPGLRFRFHRGFIIGFGHTGMFMVRRGTMVILLRFFSDGLVISTSALNPEDVIQSFRRENKYLPHGTYGLCAFELPATMEFKCTSTATEECISFSGEFEGNRLNPDGHCRVNGYPLLRRFVHHHIDGFDSFPETP
jgi:uncharacterized protein (TIGR02996 family)